MSNRLNSKKLRASAVAALVAVSTALTVVSPASADIQPDTLNSSLNPVYDQPAGLNTCDGSKLPEGKVLSADALKDATNAIAKKIADYGSVDQDEKHLAEVYANADASKPYVFTDNEEGAYKALQARLVEVTATLQQAVNNQANATASIKDAYDKDEAARKAYLNVTKLLNALTAKQREDINGLVKNVNDQNKTQFADIPYLPVSGKITPEFAFGFVASYKEHWDNSTVDFSADRNDKDYVNRYYAQALDALGNNALFKKINAALETGRKALIESQKVDIITLESQRDRARAQVLVLRLIQAKLAVMVRLHELYENDTLQENLMTVKKAYLYSLLAPNAQGTVGLAKSSAEAAANLKSADNMAVALFNGFDNDLQNNPDKAKDQEMLQWEAYRKSEARKTYTQIVNDIQWQDALENAQLQDRKAFGVKGKATCNGMVDLGATLTPGAEAPVNKKPAETPKDKPAETPKDKPAETPKDKPAKDDDQDNNTFPILPIAIAGVVLAIIAALSNVPAFLAMIPKI